MKRIFSAFCIISMLFCGCKTTSMRHDPFSSLHDFDYLFKRKPYIGITAIPGALAGAAIGATIAIVTLPIGILIVYYGLEMNHDHYTNFFYKAGTCMGLPVIFDGALCGIAGAHITESIPWSVLGWHFEKKP
jgi:hypothetical protein